LEIEKEFPISIWQWAETRLETEPSPASHSYSPPPSSIPARPSGLHGAQPSRLPLSRLQPSSRLPPFLFAQPIVQPSRRPARCSSTRVHPLSKSVAIQRVCFKLEVELSSSPRPLRVDGFPPINRSFTRRRCIQTLAAIAARACTVAPPNQGLRSQSAA
jgi:hypothetical protein